MALTQQDTRFRIHRLDLTLLVWEDVTPVETWDAPRCGGGFSVVEFREYFVVHGGYDDKGHLSGAIYLFSLPQCAWLEMQLPKCCVMPRTRHGMCIEDQALVIIGGHLTADQKLSEDELHKRHPASPPSITFLIL